MAGYRPGTRTAADRAPGAGSQPWHRQMFDPAAYRVVLLDQNAEGEAARTPAIPAAGLEGNDLEHQLANIEALRELLGIDRCWLVWGGCLGCDLALRLRAAGIRRPVTEMVLWGVTTASQAEEDWLFRGGAAAFFPQQWQGLLDAMPEARARRRAGRNLQQAARETDADVRRGAAEVWCLWSRPRPTRHRAKGWPSAIANPASRSGSRAW